MRALLSLLFLWLAAMLIIGFLGANALQSWFRMTQDQLLVREAALVASLVATTEWQEPIESDPRWEDLETRWNVDIVPIYALGNSTTRLQFTPADDTSASSNEWTQSATGYSRLSRTVEIDGVRGERGAVSAVRVTRLVRTGPLLQLWWLLWIATILLGVAIVMPTTWLLRRSAHRLRNGLLPWVQSMQGAKDSLRSELPAVPKVNGELELQLTMIRESINGWLRELQNNIQRSELVLGNLQEGVLAVDDKSHVLLANKAIDRLLGISVDNYLYRSLVEVIRVPRFVSLVERVLETRTAQEDSFEHGSQMTFLRVLARSVQLGDNRYGALVTVRDETPLRRVEQVRRDFVTNASHELKTPLAAIRAYAETLQMGAHEDTEACQQFLSGILTQADRVNGLINGMLQLARVQSGTVTLKRVKFDVCAAIATCIDAAEAVAVSKNIQIKKQLPLKPLQVVGDPESIETIVSNLISNAVRYTPDGGQVELAVFPSGKHLVMRVKDNGIGIGKDDLARVFERFYRVERARSADTGGTGLGLSIVKHLTQALGGEVTVSSELNVGSSFEVRIPLG